MKTWNLYFDTISSTVMKTEAAEQAEEQQSPSKKLHGVESCSLSD